MKLTIKFINPWLVSIALMLFTGISSAQPLMQVYKSETCGCCNDWVEHIEAAGIRVQSTNLRDMNRQKEALGVPMALASCHTAVIDGYVIEGHVPAKDILRMLSEKPAIKGLTVPGMPHGSPGMETGRIDSYEVLTFQAEDSSTEVWSRYPNP
ncbi:DUF411 domain-containing protein [Nitrincola alkalisediminis]|uniref:DUF411 domain-containing protein n=1 Tax=Nitrincola alkalisediminis TaxID=1366656 RepID=UPI001876DB9A|nr:DUF411 domain-containing protein [Nitrincola alkalisediminis]